MKTEAAETENFGIDQLLTTRHFLFLPSGSQRESFESDYCIDRAIIENSMWSKLSWWRKSVVDVERIGCARALHYY